MHLHPTPARRHYPWCRGDVVLPGGRALRGWDLHNHWIPRPVPSSAVGRNTHRVPRFGPSRAQQGKRNRDRSRPAGGADPPPRQGLTRRRGRGEHRHAKRRRGGDSYETSGGARAREKTHILMGVRDRCLGGPTWKRSAPAGPLGHERAASGWKYRFLHPCRRPRHR